MRLLPGQQKAKLQAAIKQFEETGQLSIHEPCDCGSQIRHDNGGNYHETVYLARDEGQVFAKFETSCELVPEAEWGPCQDWRKVIEDRADWL